MDGPVRPYDHQDKHRNDPQFWHGMYQGLVDPYTPVYKIIESEFAKMTGLDPTERPIAVVWTGDKCRRVEHSHELIHGEMLQMHPKPIWES